MNSSSSKFCVPGFLATKALLLMITVLSVALITESAVAGPSCARNPDNPKCVKDDPGGSGKVYAVKVTFDDTFDINIKSDGNDYISDSGADPDSGVGAGMPVEFSPPGQFVMTLRLGGDRYLFFDFGEAVDCTDGSPKDACVKDKYGKVLPCLFPPDLRLDVERCSGFKKVVMAFRHTVDASGNEDQYMLGMDNTGGPFDGEAGDIEFDFREENKRDDDLRLHFDANCLGQIGGEFLKITAWDEDTSDELPNDHWVIETFDDDTDTTTKEACLAKKGNGKTQELVGVFDMQFSYEICILANPDGAAPGVDPDECLKRPPP